jgi:phosphoinositide-3-kinase regulatory subunit 4
LSRFTQGNFDTRLSELHSTIQDHLSPLLSDPSPSVKRALLTNISMLCTFFGRLKANDAVLAHLVTYLNTRDWLLRKKWNEEAVGVAECVGKKSLEEYILPLIVLSLAGASRFPITPVPYP